MMAGTLTDAERRGWQRRNAAVLVDLLAAAHNADLPPLSWSVTVTTGLVGRCTAMDMPARRTEFEAWAQFLAPVQRWPEHAHAGISHLRAIRSSYGSGVSVAVLADIYHEPADGLAEVVAS